MKLVCLDLNNCGYYNKIEDQDDPYYETNTCPECLGIAVVFDKNYKPIFYNTEKDVDELLAIVANMFNHLDQE